MRPVPTDRTRSGQRVQAVQGSFELAGPFLDTYQGALPDPFLRKAPMATNETVHRFARAAAATAHATARAKPTILIAGQR